MCFGGSSKGNTQAPPPSQPTTFSYDPPESQAQRNHNATVRAANADTINSATMAQVGGGQSFGAELGAAQGG